MGKFGLTSKELKARVRALKRKTPVKNGQAATVLESLPTRHVMEFKVETDGLVVEEVPFDTTEEIIEYPQSDANMINIVGYSRP